MISCSVFGLANRSMAAVVGYTGSEELERVAAALSKMWAPDTLPCALSRAFVATMHAVSLLCR